MFESVVNFFRSLGKNKNDNKSKDAAKERLHLVLMQDRANVSADFLDLMKQEIIEVIKKYIDVDENAIDVRLTNKSNDDGTTGAPVLYANIPIVSVKEEAKEEARKVKTELKEKKEEPQKIDNKETKNNNENDNKDSVEQKDVKDKTDNKELKSDKEEKKDKEQENVEEIEEETQEVIEKAEEIVEEIKEEAEKEETIKK